MRELGNGVSCDMLRRGCETNVADGLADSSVRAMSRLGHSGTHPYNMHRDLKRFLKKQGVDGIEPLFVDVPVQRLRGVGIQWISVPVLLPLDIIAFLYQNASTADFREQVMSPGCLNSGAELVERNGSSATLREMRLKHGLVGSFCVACMVMMSQSTIGAASWCLPSAVCNAGWGPGSADGCLHSCEQISWCLI